MSSRNFPARASRLQKTQTQTSNRSPPSAQHLPAPHASVSRALPFSSSLLYSPLFTFLSIAPMPLPEMDVDVLRDMLRRLNGNSHKGDTKQHLSAPITFFQRSLCESTLCCFTSLTLAYVCCVLDRTERARWPVVTASRTKAAFTRECQTAVPAHRCRSEMFKEMLTAHSHMFVCTVDPLLRWTGFTATEQ